MRVPRNPYRAVFQYPDNGQPNSGAIFHAEPTTRRLAQARMTYWKRLMHTKKDPGAMWLERFIADEWRRL